MNAAFFLCHGWHINTSACCTLPPCPAGCRGGTNRDVIGPVSTAWNILDPSLLVVRDTDGCSRYMYIFTYFLSWSNCLNTVCSEFWWNLPTAASRAKKAQCSCTSRSQTHLHTAFFAAKTNWTTEQKYLGGFAYEMNNYPAEVWDCSWYERWNSTWSEGV